MSHIINVGRTLEAYYVTVFSNIDRG